MHVHKPKPVEGMIAFASEIGVIVVGVLIALGAEQIVDEMRWEHKVKVAEAGIQSEFSQRLGFAKETVDLKVCLAPYVDALETAIVHHDTASIQKLSKGSWPFVTRPWGTASWQAVVSTQVADHLERKRLDLYAFMAVSLEDIRHFQERMLVDYVDATVGKLGAPVDPAATQMQLAAAERFRSDVFMEQVISASILKRAHGVIEPDPAVVAGTEAQSEACLANVNAARAGPSSLPVSPSAPISAKRGR